MTTTTSREAQPVPSFLDAETAGGDELRACDAAHLSTLVAEAFAAAEAEAATWTERTGRDLRASKALVRRAYAIAERVSYYVGVKLDEAREAHSFAAI